MAAVAPAPGAGLPWYVYAVAYPNAPSTSVPFITQTQESGTNPLAGPFASRAAANAWVAAHPQDFGPGLTNIAPPSDTPVTSGIPGNPLTGIDAIGNLANKLSEKNFWIRVGEFAVGFILLDVGLKSLTGTSIIEKTTSTVKKVGKTGATAAAFL